MAQYSTYTDGVTVEYTDGVDTFRNGSIGGAFVTEKLDGASWSTLEMIDLEGSADTGVFRDGTRGSSYVVDKTLNATGFNGTESLDEGLTGDWINLVNLNID